MESKPSDFLNTFDKTITCFKEVNVPQNKLMDYFEQGYYQFRKRAMKLKMHKTWIAEQLSLLMIVQVFNTGLHNR